MTFVYTAQTKIPVLEICVTIKLWTITTSRLLQRTLRIHTSLRIIAIFLSPQIIIPIIFPQNHQGGEGPFLCSFLNIEDSTYKFLSLSSYRQNLLIVAYVLWHTRICLKIPKQLSKLITLILKDSVPIGFPWCIVYLYQKLSLSCLLAVLCMGSKPPAKILAIDLGWLSLQVPGVIHDPLFLRKH